MKKNIISFGLIILTMLIYTLPAAAQSSASATFFSENGEKFWVVMNGVKINQDAHYRVEAKGLDQPGYKVKVIFQDQGLGTMDKNITTQNYENNEFMDVVYAIKKNKKGEYVMRVASFDEADQMAPAKQAETPQQSPAAAQGSAVTEKTTVTTTTTSQGNAGAPGEVVNVGMSVGGESMNINIGMSDPNGMGITTQQTTITTTTTTTNTTSSSDMSSNNSTPPPAPVEKGCTSAMSPTDYNNAKNSIKNQSFTESQMKVASQVVKSNCLNVSQVKGIMEIFSFEENKLEFAKMAYPKTVDKGNYYQLNDGFTYSSSVDELNSFLETQE